MTWNVARGAAAALGLLWATGCGDGTVSDDEAGGDGPDAGPPLAVGGEGGMGGSGGMAGFVSMGGSAGGGPVAGSAGMGPSGDCTLRFVAPLEGSLLAESDDDDGDCSNGFSISVRVETDAPPGTEVELVTNQTIVGTALVGPTGRAQLTDVALPVNAEATLSARITSPTDCTASALVTAECDGPTCVLSEPAITPMHPKLNGILVADGGDRVSPLGDPYKTSFAVTTNLDDGDPVALAVGDVVLLGEAEDGVARFPDVELDENETASAQATCTDAAGTETVSDEVSLVVDTEAPEISGLPAEGAHFGPEDDDNDAQPGLQFLFCASTTSEDALDLPSSLGDGQENLRIAIGAASPVAIRATTGGSDSGDGACVRLECNGPAPQDYTVELLDDAGNVNRRVIQDITCTASTPTVEIVDPVAQTTDPDTHVLAVGNGTTRVDQALDTGAQYTVVACTDQSSGTAELYAWTGNADARPGSASATSTDFAPASGGDGCSNGFDYVVRFVNATLPDSLPGTGPLTTPTRLEVDVTSGGETGSSPTVETWVDSTAVALLAVGISDGGGAPAPPLCGKEFGPGDRSETVRIANTISPVALSVSNGGEIYSSNAPTPGCGGLCLEFSDVTLQDGTNVLRFWATEPSGNAATFPINPCTIQVGALPGIAFVAPVDGDTLNLQGGTGAVASTGSTNGTWKGTLSVDTDLEDEILCDGGTCLVELFADSVSLGTTSVDADTGMATLDVSIPDGEDVTLRAETEDFGFGAGATEISIPFVDTRVPRHVTSLTATVSDPRGADFALSFTAQSDGASASDPASATSYVLVYSETSFGATDGECQTNAALAESVEIDSSATTGSTVTGTIPDLDVGTDYYFAVAPLDAAGNRGGFACTAVPVLAELDTNVIVSPTTNGSIGFGINIDGSADLGGPTSGNGSPIYDVLVGSSGREAFVHFGTVDGLSATPATRFFDERSGLGVVSGYGYDARVVGDINGDDYADIAIGAPLGAYPYGVVYLYFGGPSGWSGARGESDGESDANATITSDAGFEGSAPDPGPGGFGTSIAPLGDVNGDSYDDFAVGVPQWSAQDVGRVVVVWGQASFTTFTLTQSGQTSRTSFINCPASVCNTSGGNDNFTFGRKVVAAPGVNGTSHGLVVSTTAGEAASTATASAVSLFTYSGGSYAHTASYDHYDTAGAQTHLGVSLGVVGGLPNGTAVVAGAPAGVEGQRAFAFFGNDASVFSTFSEITRTEPTNEVDSFGLATMGTRLFELVPAPSDPNDQLQSGFSDANLVGDATGDLVITGLRDGDESPQLYIIDGDNLTAGSHLAPEIADLIVPFPAGFAANSGATFGSTVVRDVNGDGKADIVIGENNGSYGSPLYFQPSNNPGSIWVVY